MTTLEQAARQALEALENINNTDSYWWQEVDEQTIKELDDAEKAMRLALEQPPKREWVGLTDEELVAAYISVGDKEWAIGGMRDATKFARAIEAKLKEKTHDQFKR